LLESEIVVSEVQRNMATLEKIVVEDQEIVALSKSSKEHMILMSHEQYKKLYAKAEILEDKITEYETKLDEIEAKIAIYEGILTSQGQFYRGEGEDAKAQLNAQHKERLYAVQINSTPSSSTRTE
jgi:PHD/YefM family antitoxin component YafN of YafNO toxin-antitoxin module